MRVAASLIVSLLIVAVLWNFTGRVTLPDVDPTYMGSVLEGSLGDVEINAEGVALVKDWLENRTRPSVDPIKIIAHQFWYNAVTRGYDLKLWIEPREYRTRSELYGIYQKDNYLVLRIEYRRKNRILVPSFTASELEEALKPFAIAN